MYDIIFYYHPRNEEDGKYDTTQTLTFTKTVGKRKEVPLEKVAVLVMGELSRRDLWVINVEVFELARREITFKETKGGIILKNKKFQFDQLQGELVSEDIVEESSGIKFSDNRQQKVVSEPKGPLRHEVFRPSKEDLGVLNRQGLKLTLNKPYPVFKEVIKGMMEPIYYQVVDDQGNFIEVSSLFFEPMRRGLVGVGMNDPLPLPPEGKLSYVDTSPHSGDEMNMASMIAQQDAVLLRRG